MLSEIHLTIIIKKHHLSIAWQYQLLMSDTFCDEKMFEQAHIKQALTKNVH
jgi:hypothetical protein